LTAVLQHVLIFPSGNANIVPEKNVDKSFLCFRTNSLPLEPRWLIRLLRADWISWPVWQHCESQQRMWAGSDVWRRRLQSCRGNTNEEQLLLVSEKLTMAETSTRLASGIDLAS